MSFVYQKILLNVKNKAFFYPKYNRYQHSYRNRYTHFINAYPRKIFERPYAFYCLAIGGGFIYYGLSGDSWLGPHISTLCPKSENISIKKVVKCETSNMDDTDEPKKTKNSFRSRKFIAYEDRIRAYSTPDKIFRYFATLKHFEEDGSFEIFMTPEDFLRAITPGVKQPDGLALDSFKRFNSNDDLNLSIAENSIFYCLGNKALISFTDFIFLLTVISTPQRQFEIAFRMFDLNGDGELDSNEFNVVRSVILDTTAMGKRHRDHVSSTIKPVHHSALNYYFFGKDGKSKLTIAKFLDFQSRLQEEITHLEFERLQPEDGLISEREFAKSLLIYGGYSENKRRLMLRRVKQKFTDDKCVGITYNQFLDFSRLLRSITELDTALTFHTLAGAAIDQLTFLHMARVVANVELTPHVTDVVFTLFDENGDGELSYREFVQVMKNRLMRGLDKPMDMGFVRFINSLAYCLRQEIKRRIE